MNRFIRGLDNREKLNRVLRNIGFKAIEEDYLYTMEDCTANKSGLYIYLIDNSISINIYGAKSLITLPIDRVELRFFICDDYISVELLYVDNKIKLLQQLFRSEDKTLINRVLKELKEDLED